MISSTKKALITGVTGQDGAYLTQLLLEKGYEVHGIIRWDAMDGKERLKTLNIDQHKGLTLHIGDLTDALNITRLIKEIKPSEIYNLGAMTQVHVSFRTPSSTIDINAKGTLNVLEAVRVLEMQDRVRIYQASSSEMFGNAPAPQNEKTPFQPVSPYGVAKLAGYHLAKIYRESYGFHVSNGILFNHESPLRGEHFVTRKIVKAIAQIEAGQKDFLSLGNLSAKRDWGHARDYVRGMWMMLQQEEPDDYVLATGKAHSVREATEACFKRAGIEIKWEGHGMGEIGVDAQSDKILVRVDARFFRPKDVHNLLGDATKAHMKLGWRPEISFDNLVTEMMNAEREMAQRS